MMNMKRKKVMMELIIQTTIEVDTTNLKLLEVCNTMMKEIRKKKTMKKRTMKMKREMELLEKRKMKLKKG